MAEEIREVSPAEAWAWLAREPQAVLVDVRTRPEWQYVGTPDLRPLGREALKISWQEWPSMAVNPAFAAELARQVRPDQPVLFLCRSGVRSLAAAKAAQTAGYRTCVNILEGFEGNKDAAGHRGGLGGWRKAGLPWTQE